jgi:hypothetical protein
VEGTLHKFNLSESNFDSCGLRLACLESEFDLYFIHVLLPVLFRPPKMWIQDCEFADADLLNLIVLFELFMFDCYFQRLLNDLSVVSHGSFKFNWISNFVQESNLGIYVQFGCKVILVNVCDDLLHDRGFHYNSFVHYKFDFSKDALRCCSKREIPTEVCDLSSSVIDV